MRYTNPHFKSNQIYLFQQLVFYFCNSILLTSLHCKATDTG